MSLRSAWALCLCAAAACGGGATDNSSPATPVNITDGIFSPAALTVTAGTAVRWTNNGTLAHTVTADGGAFASGQLTGPTQGGGAYGGSASGEAFTRTFATAGTFAYHCDNHPAMTGTVTVTP